jgi:Protein of unknown function (DUF1501)
MTLHTRRDLLRLTCCSAVGASLVSGLSKLGLVSALAQGTTDYKALVCIFLFGGNDGNNLLVPTDSRYTQYLQARSVLALPENQLLPLQVSGQSIYGLHPNMPEMQGYFNNQKSLAIVTNVGTLVQPTTQATYRAFKNLPANLFSHSTSRTSGSAHNSSERRYLAGPAGLPTMSRRSTLLRSFHRFSRFPEVPSSAPVSARSPSRWSQASRRVCRVSIRRRHPKPGIPRLSNC